MPIQEGYGTMAVPITESVNGETIYPGQVVDVQIKLADRAKLLRNE